MLPAPQLALPRDASLFSTLCPSLCPLRSRLPGKLRAHHPARYAANSLGRLVALPLCQIVSCRPCFAQPMYPDSKSFARLLQRAAPEKPPQLKSRVLISSSQSPHSCSLSPLKHSFHRFSTPRSILATSCSRKANAIAARSIFIRSNAQSSTPFAKPHL